MEEFACLGKVFEDNIISCLRLDRKRKNKIKEEGISDEVPRL